MSRRLTPLGLSVLLLPVLGSVAAAQKPTAAVLGIETRGAQNQELVLVGKLMTAKLRAEVAKPNSPYVLSRVEEDFLTIKIMHDCPGGAHPCMSRITKDVLRAQYSIYGFVEKDQSGYVFQLTLLNAETAQPEGQLTEVVPLADAPDDSRAGRYARAFYNKLIGRSQEGKLVVRSNVAAGEVFVDGKSVGNLADGVVVVNNIAPGDHVVTVDSDGQSAKATVKVIAGEASEVELTVTPNIGPPGGGGGGGSNTGWKIAFYGGLAATAVAGAGWAYYGGGVYITKRYEEEVQRVNSAGTPELSGKDICASSDIDMRPDVKDACDEGNTAADRSTIFGIATGIGAVATLFFAYKAFFSSGTTTERDDLSARTKRREPRVRILPGGPGDIGAGLEVTF